MKELGDQIYEPEKREDFFKGKQLFGTKSLRQRFLPCPKDGVFQDRIKNKLN